MQYISKPIVFNYSICQNKTIFEQLEDGIRYLDFRIVKNENHELGSICHCLDGGFVIDMFEQISKFIKKNKQEIIFIDIKKVYGFDEEELKKWLKLFEKYCFDLFGDSICPSSISTSTPIKELWKDNRQLILFLPFENEFFWNFNLMNRSWANSPNDQEVIKYIDEEISKHQDDRFHLSEFIITIRDETVKKNFYSNLKSLSHEPNKKFMKKIKESKDGFNIICCDFYHEFEFVKICIEKNF